MKTLKDLKIGDTVFTVENDTMKNNIIIHLSKIKSERILGYKRINGENERYSKDTGGDYDSKADDTFIICNLETVYFNHSEAIQVVKYYLQNLLTKKTVELKELSENIEDINNRIKKYL